MGAASIAQACFNKITLIALVCISIFLLFMVYNVYHFRLIQQQKGVEFRSMFILIPITAVGLVIATIRYINHKQLRPKIIERLNHLQKYYTESSVTRSEKYSIDMIHYLITTIWGFYLTYNIETIPIWVGGQCSSCSNLMPNFPQQNKYEVYWEGFFILQTAHHIYNLVQQFVLKGSSFTFNEMILHHLMSCSLIFSAYAVNQVEMIVIVLLVHDASDFLIKTMKTVRDLELFGRNFQDLNFFTLAIVFSYGRIIVPIFCYLPSLNSLINHWYVDNKDTFGVDFYYMWFPIYVMWVMLVLLVFMNIFWYVFLVYLGFKRICTGTYYSMIDVNYKKSDPDMESNSKLQEPIKEDTIENGFERRKLNDNIMNEQSTSTT